MDRYSLPKSTKINGITCAFYSDYRAILELFKILNDVDLLEQERVIVALDTFYKDDKYKCNVEQAIKEMYLFINGGEEISKSTVVHKPLFDWEQDFNLIAAPVNNNLNEDIRGIKYLHWWTFLASFMEIGECTFNTYVGIRDKLNRGIKLDKFEERIYKDNEDKIVLKKKYDKTTQALIDSIMGGGD